MDPDQVRHFVGPKEVQADLGLSYTLPTKTRSHATRLTQCSLICAFIFPFQLNGHRRERTCLQGFANNTGEDQPARPRSLISAFVVRFLENFICKLATDEISIF